MNQRTSLIVAVVAAVIVGLGIGALVFGVDDSGDGDTTAGSDTTVAGGAADGSSTPPPAW